MHQASVLGQEGWRVGPGWRMRWNPETFEINLWSPTCGLIGWIMEDDLVFPVTRRFIETEWQFECLAQLVALTHGLDTKKMKGHHKDFQSPKEAFRVELWIIEFVAPESP